MEKQKVWDVWLTVWICKKQSISCFLSRFGGDFKYYRFSCKWKDCSQNRSAFMQSSFEYVLWIFNSLSFLSLWGPTQRLRFDCLWFFSQLLFGRALEICIYFPYLSDGNWVQREQLAVRKPYESGNTSLTKDIWKYLQSCIIRSVA